jgi:ABC-2 type transport system ATP-binding protein
MWARELACGLARLACGLARVAAGLARLAAGLARVAAGLAELTCGFAKLTCGLARVAAGLATSFAGTRGADSGIVQEPGAGRLHSRGRNRGASRRPHALTLNAAVLNPRLSQMIRVENLSKFYGGKRALGPVTFTIEDGETVGFLGLNGAGKTTALRIIACDLRPSAGTVSVGEVDAIAQPHEVRKRVGFVPEFPPIYQDMQVTDYLRFAGRLRGMSSREVEKRLPVVLGRTHLDDVSREIIGHLSHGYRQRVGVAQAIMHNPRLLILDEPTRGLDPVQIVEMRNMINGLKESHTVLISSHILTEISHTCDRILVLGKGEILASGTERELTTGMAQVRKVTVLVRARGAAEGKDASNGDESKEAGDADPVEECLRGVDGVTSVTSAVSERERARIYVLECSRDVRADVGRAVVAAGHDLLKLDHSHSELERIFLELVQGGGDAHH